MNVDGEDGVAPRAVLVHVVSPDRSVLQTLLSDIQIQNQISICIRNLKTRNWQDYLT